MSPPSAKLRQALEAKAKGLPTGPGVYQFKSERGTVLYVGKAQNLRGRVRQYIGGGDGRMQIPALMDRVADVDVLATANVKEALLLENECQLLHKRAANFLVRTCVHTCAPKKLAARPRRSAAMRLSPAGS